ncbi:hypothetical protein ABT084_12400 [Streptomyces sp. NPDC002138]|uniref:hypothetical protein n=1 Tax=Streptomyces sp. NPDC002138 TaxID=3154410 RepID=UPI003330B0B1
MTTPATLYEPTAAVLHTWRPDLAALPPVPPVPQLPPPSAPPSYDYPLAPPE